MGFLDFFRPKWRHSDFDTRAQAVRDLSDDELAPLEEVAKSDPDPRVRRIAVKKIFDPAILRRVAAAEADEALREVALEKATALLVDAAVARGDEGRALIAPLDALAQIEDQRAVAKVVQKAARDDVRKAALAQLRDAKLLAEVTLKAEKNDLRLAALARIGDPLLLAHIARDSDVKAVAADALERVSDPEQLAIIARDGRIKAVRQAAQARLPRVETSLSHDDEEAEAAARPKANRAPAMNQAEAKKLRQRQLQVCLALEPLCRTSHDWAAVEAGIAEAQLRWDEIGPVPGDKQLQDRFAQAKKAYYTRKQVWEHDQIVRAEQHRREEEKRRRDQEEAAARARAEADAGVKAESDRAQREAAEAERKAARERDREHDAVRSVEDELAQMASRAERMLERERIPFDRLDEMEARWRELDTEAAAPVVAEAAPVLAPVAVVPTPPAPILPADTATANGSAIDDGWDEPSVAPAVAEAAPAVAEAAPVVAEAAPVVAEAAPVAAPAAAPVAADDSPRAALRRRFFSALTVARTRAQESAARREAEQAEKLVELQKVAERLERLVEASDARKVDAAIKQARATARKLGPAASPAETELRERANRALDALVVRLAALNEAEGWRRWANLPKFEELIKEAEALAEVIDTVEDKRHAPGVLKELQARWKVAGTLPQEKSQQLWERFKKATDSVHEKTRAFFAALDADRPENLKKKEALCEKVEALVDSSDWKATSLAIKLLQDEWKTIGPVPEEQREAIWKRFRGACDRFFDRRAANDKSRDEERAANVTRKEELCARAEGLALSTDWRAAADQIKDLQEEWKTVGPVPKASGDALWKRFRGACDAFFDRRKAAFEAQDAERGVNLEKKTALCVEAEALADVEDQNAAIEKVKELQAQWKRVGHVPRDQSDAIWNRFRAACDRVFDGPSLEELQPEDRDRLGIGGFVNRLPLGDLAAKLAAARAEAPAKQAAESDDDDSAASEPAPAAPPADAAGEEKHSE
jgi:hypothetical protein